MSTKATIAMGGNFHFYQDCMDEDNVYLEIDKGNFTATRDSVTVEIPIEIFEVIRQYGVFSGDLVGKTDREIQEQAETYVRDRMARAEEAKAKHGKAGLLSIMGSMTYGTTDDPVDKQVAKGVARLKEAREQQNARAAMIEELKETQRRKP